jgi:ribosomal protein S16
MVVIRLARGGAKKRPFYSIVRRIAARATALHRAHRVLRPEAPEGRRLPPQRRAARPLDGKGAKLSPTVARLVKSRAKPAATASWRRPRLCDGARGGALRREGVGQDHAVYRVAGHARATPPGGSTAAVAGVTVEDAVHGASVVARLAGCDDRDAAARFEGIEPAVPREARAGPGRVLLGRPGRPGRGEYGGWALGTVQALFSTGAYDVMRAGEEGRAAVAVRRDGGEGRSRDAADEVDWESTVNRPTGRSRQ